MTNREKDLNQIAEGKCVSPYTVDRCVYCVDRCKASEARQRLNNLLDGTGVSKVKK